MKKVLLSAMLLVGGVALMSAQSVQGSVDMTGAKKASIKPKKEKTKQETIVQPVKMSDPGAHEQAKANARAKEDGKVAVEPSARKKN
ncbi:hypothetical protein ACK1KB_03810 [Chryseobacterium sp. TY3]